MKQNDILHRRNKLLVNIIWGMLVLGIAVDYITGAPANSIIVLIIVGFATCGIATIMTYKRWLEPYIMYVISSIVTLLTVLLIITGPVITTYFLVFVNLTIMTLYTNFRAILFSGLLGLGLTVYFFLSPYKEEMFGNHDPITIVMYLVLVTVPLLVSAKFGERLQSEATSQREKAIAEQQLSQAIIDKVSASLSLLNDFSAKLKQNITSTGTISKEVTESFEEISSSTESQTTSITDISDSIRMMMQAVASLADRSTEMKALTDNSVKLTMNSSDEAKSLALRMEQVHATIDASVALMNELNDQNKRIGDIVATINHISTQTNLLSLNAAIEAARAGEHGKGFAVVSGEIRKLAETSQQSTEEIVSILETIRSKTDKAAEQIVRGQQTVIESGDAVNRVAEAMRLLAGNSGSIDDQSAQVERSADDLHRQYTKIADEILTIAGITEQNMASIKQMLTNMNMQDGRIRDIVESFLQLDKLTTDLNKMTDM